MRIALANLPMADTPDASVASAVAAVAEAGASGAAIICFPECFVPGYRWTATSRPASSPAFLEAAIRDVAQAARDARVAVVLGTERITEHGLQITACVLAPEGHVMGWQDKVQLDPSEEPIYPARGAARHVFTVGELTFGVVICHEGWRYPETVRSAVRQGAQVVFHPHAGVAEPGSFRPETFGDPANSFHENAVRCRAAENSCYFASVNYASVGSPTTYVVAGPDGTVVAYQPYGEPGLLLVELDLDAATGFLASRLRTA